jgi:hypothetical protein
MERAILRAAWRCRAKEQKAEAGRTQQLLNESGRVGRRAAIYTTTCQKVTKAGEFDALFLTLASLTYTSAFY